MAFSLPGLNMAPSEKANMIKMAAAVINPPMMPLPPRQPNGLFFMPSTSIDDQRARVA
jgi:hypothetical protein